eukprot:1330844-Amorphochlora_amoeboformis.AAC.2
MATGQRAVLAICVLIILVIAHYKLMKVPGFPLLAISRDKIKTKAAKRLSEPQSRLTPTPAHGMGKGTGSREGRVSVPFLLIFFIQKSGEEHVHKYVHVCVHACMHLKLTFSFVMRTILPKKRESGRICQRKEKERYLNIPMMWCIDYQAVIGIFPIFVVNTILDFELHSRNPTSARIQTYQGNQTGLLVMH